MSKKFITKVSTAVVSVATVVSLSGAGALLPMATHGQSVADLQAQISALLAQINALQSQLSTATSAPSGTVPASLLTSGDLTLGSKGAAVKDLQQFLNANSAEQVAQSGPGAPGAETEYFGSLTRAALAKWQAANGVAPAAGYFGPLTRAKLSAMAAATPATPATPSTPSTPSTPAPAGTGLTVSLAANQPAPSLAPASASRIPFTKIALTASADGDVTVNSVKVERTGLASDSALAAVLLLDSEGNQLGLKKSLNSLHQATVGEDFVVKAGTTEVLTVAANRAAAASLGGQTIALTVVDVNTSADLHGTMPVTGTTHTVNETLSVGTVSMARGPLDPGASQTKEIGTTGYTFSSVRVTAGSAEKVWLKSMRWNQTGSASSNDLANVKTYVDGTAYDTLVSADGKYYTTTFPGDGILIDKGFNKEVYVKADIVGGSLRTVDFDIAKRTDLFVMGETYGYGIIPPQTGASDPTDDTAAFSSVEDPWYDAAQVEVSAGTMTVSAWSQIAAQNLAINLNDQELGGWVVDVKGEAISVANMKFNFTISDSDGGGENALTDLDNLKLVDESGATLAGPIDAAGTGLSGTETFTDTITFPVGITRFKMVGKLATNFENNDTVQASTTPSSQFVTVTGQTTGNSITPSPTSAVSGQTMTVKAAAMTISVSSVPIAQTIIAGAQQFEFARYILDTASSGEDLRLTSLPLEYNVKSGSATDLTNCYLYDGSTRLNTGSNVVNPSAAASSTAFTFDGSGLTLAKGTSKQVSLKCDLKSTATGVYEWGYDTTSAPSPTGLVSGQSATLTENDSEGQLMTASTGGSLTVSLDASSPTYTLGAPGVATELAKYKFTATNEDISLKQVALQLSGTASNSQVDLVNQKVTLHDESGTQVGEATFSTGDNATSSAITGFTIPKNASKVLTVKGTFANISSSGPLERSGDLVKVDWDGNNTGLNGTYGTGSESGSTVTPTGSDTASQGVRVMKTYPTVEKVNISSSLVNGEQPILRFKVTANGSEDVALYKFTVRLATTSAVAADLNAYAYADSGFSNAASGVNDGGKLMNSDLDLTTLWAGSATDLNVVADSAGTATVFQIPAGSTRYFEVRANMTGVDASGDSISTQLQGDAAYPSLATWMTDATTADDDDNDDFIWSPNSTTTAAPANLDFTNGYNVSGLPSANMTAQVLSK